MRSLFVVCLFIVATVAAAAQTQDQGSVVQLDSGLNGIVPPEAKVEKLADSPATSRVPDTREGPVWVRKGGYLLYSVLGTKVINKWDPRDGKVSTFLENTDSDGVTLDPEGRIVWAGGGQVVRVDRNGHRAVLASQYQGRPLANPNDLVFKTDGTLYFTDEGDAAPAVYLLRGRKLQLLTKDITRPNGIAFSPGEKYLYVNSSDKMTIVRFDVLRDDSVANGEVFIDMNSKGAPPGFPDGMKVDEKGNVYCTGPGGVWIISPEGKHLGTILGLNRPANLTFGGSDGKTLFITSRPGLYRIRLKIPGIRP